MSYIFKKMIILKSIIILPVLFSTILYSNNAFPERRIVNWKKAGLYSDYKEVADNWINMEDYSGSDNQKILNAIEDAAQLTGQTVIYFPKPNYNFTQTIEINSGNPGTIRFLGNLSEDTLTVLTFQNLSSHENCVYVKGRRINNQVSITEDLKKAEQKIYYNDTAGVAFSNQDWILFTEQGLDDNYGDSSAYIGQISQVQNTAENYITIKDRASKAYSASNNMQLQKIEPVKNIGFENFIITRNNEEKGQGATFKFNLAVNCWIKGVESYNCTGYHTNISRSSHILINGCYFHKATNYDSHPGSGYGVVLGHSTTNCLIENNIFTSTRHAMLVGTGANRNVFRFNYAANNKWDVSALGEDLQAGDIRLHGRYPYANLFEGNSVGFVWGDATHGLNGPYNTIFRNKVRQNLHTFYAKSVILWNSDSTNIGSNVLKSGIDTVASKFNQQLQQQIDNYNQQDSRGVIHIPNSSVISYYSKNRPDYFNEMAYSWPAIGNTAENNIIPAGRRWQHDSTKTYYLFGKLEIANPLEEIEVNEDAVTEEIDLGDIFHDPGNSDDEIKKSILANNNSSLVLANIEQDSLVLKFRENQSGTAEIVIRGRSNLRAANDSLIVTVKPVNDAPVFTRVLQDTTINNRDNFSFSYQAADIEDDPLIFGIQNQIPGLSIKSHGELSWSVPDDPDEQYTVSVFVTDSLDTSTTSAAVKINDVVALGETGNIPQKYTLGQNYPNPFNPLTTIKYALPEKADVEISIFNLNGALVETILNKNKKAGYHKILWNAKAAPTGVYLYRIKAEQYTDVKKCVLIK